MNLEVLQAETAIESFAMKTLQSSRIQTIAKGAVIGILMAQFLLF
jgi:hypothetical protein